MHFRSLHFHFISAGSAILQGATCGLASYFPTKYMQAFMTGQVSLHVMLSLLFNQLTTALVSFVCEDRSTLVG